MKVVIDISDRTYYEIMDLPMLYTDNVDKIIRQGIPVKETVITDNNGIETICFVKENLHE